jgi:hypothetical protein
VADRELQRLQQDWKSGDKFAPFFALSHCQHRKLKPPPWVLNAVVMYGMESYIKDVRAKMESSREQRIQQDQHCRSLALLFRKTKDGRKRTWDKAYTLAAESLGLTFDQVRNADMRVRRLEKAGKLV